MVMARKGDWVQIHGIVLKPEERAPQIPDDTKAVSLEIRIRGFLCDDEAGKGDQVKVKTLAGRIARGELEEINPAYTHSFGDCVPELLRIGPQLREILSGGGSNEK